jgi:hypothetical protein
MTYAEVIGKLMDRTPPFHVNGLAAMIAMLRFNYHVMVAHGPLLDLAAEVAMGPLMDGEPTLARYYAAHAEEEREHAQWLKEDLLELGADVLGPDHVAASIAGAQYYYLHHIGAVPFLGYLAAFELRPLKPSDLEIAKRLTGGRGLRTLAHHAEHDPHHAADLAAMMQNYAHEELIAYNAMMTHSMYMEYAKQRINEALAMQAEAKETTLWH